MCSATTQECTSQFGRCAPHIACTWPVTGVLLDWCCADVGLLISYPVRNFLHAADVDAISIQNLIE